MIPIDLARLAGTRYRTSLDPSIAMNPSRSERGWYIRLTGPRGFISPHGKDTLAAYATGRTARRLATMPGTRVHQLGDREVRVIFRPEDLDAIADAIGAYRRPSLTDAERARRAERARSLRKTPVPAT